MHGKELPFDPRRAHPESALAAYLGQWLDRQEPQQQTELSLQVYAAGAFLKELAQFENLSQRLVSRARKGPSPAAQPTVDQAFQIARTTHSPRRAWSLFVALQRLAVRRDTAQFPGPALHGRLAELALRFRDVPGLSYAARYEHTRELHAAATKDASGDPRLAAESFEKLYREGIAAGTLPPIDRDLRRGLTPDEGESRWPTLIRDAARILSLAGHHKAGATVALAWQCEQVGDPTLALEMIGLAEAQAFADGSNTEQRTADQAAVLDFLTRTQRPDRAAELVKRLLVEHPASSSLWRLSARLAQERGRTGESVAALERALEEEYRQLPETIDVRLVREDYAALLSGLEGAAETLAALDAGAADGLVDRVLRAADRWRSLDTDPTAACQAAARVLVVLRRREQAWEYLTTPLAERPNEAAPWLALARELASRPGDLELTSRAYGLAYEAEATNADILWDHAQFLIALGRPAEARPLLEKIQSGTWQPRFEHLKEKAKTQLVK
jgi:tetratricopeptide (TPR) repeat protein